MAAVTASAARTRLAVLLLAGFVAACDDPPPNPLIAPPTNTQEPSSAALSSPPSASASTPPLQPPPPAGKSRRVVLLAGGDVSLGRLRGQRLLRNPTRQEFAAFRDLFATADLRFVNLECPLSDQDGETQSPANKLVFTGPPIGADALARGSIDIVSLANNHAWDYGRSALLETFENLERVGVTYVGAGRTTSAAYGARLMERNGLRIAFVAATDIWNQNLEPHPGKALVADARADASLNPVPPEQTAFVNAVRAARARDDVDRVVVSFHGGDEYVDRSRIGIRRLLDAVVRAGADVVIGHHPHVIQPVVFVDGAPVFYSIGNMLMRMVTGKPWTQFGMLARVELDAAQPTEIAICPFRIHGMDQVPLASDPQRTSVERTFRFKLERLLALAALVQPGQGATLGTFDAAGCAPIHPIEP